MSTRYLSLNKYLHKISITCIILKYVFGFKSTQGRVEANGSFMELVDSGIDFIKSIEGNIRDEIQEDKTFFDEDKRCPMNEGTRETTNIQFSMSKKIMLQKRKQSTISTISSSSNLSEVIFKLSYKRS